MVMNHHERWAIALSHLVCQNAGLNARWLAHPCDDHGVPLPEQPTPEESANAERDAEDCEHMAGFYGELLRADDAARAKAGLPKITGEAAAP